MELIVAHPGKDKPKASTIHAIVTAVPIMLQAPGVKQVSDSNIFNSSLLIFPDLYFPIASLISEVTNVFPLNGPFVKCLASIIPPVKKIVGILHLAAANNIPGIILSHEHSITIPSKSYALIVHSIEFAITSLVGRIKRELFPEFAIPSQEPIVLNSIGVPPASLTPFFTNSDNFRR